MLFTLENFNQWRIEHYTQRVAEEKAKGNTAAVMFLRTELYNLKKGSNE